MFLVLEDIKKEIEDYGERFKLLKTKGFEYPDDEVTTVRIKILVLNPTPVGLLSYPYKNLFRDQFDPIFCIGRGERPKYCRNFFKNRI